MAFDISKHNLVPKHTKVSDSEKAKLFEKYLIGARELPKIMKDDPAIAKLSLKGGDIVKIERASKTVGMTTYYRAVVEE
ncbi:MAG: DNA-directed RNA polymerase subunit H [archaeon GW2011_AR9]|nr:MAG: DNA-directed RNA polymerase subunit H [archaeon GW2011_AR9]HIG93085.1 DNA-directed RNA polymerase subunit H [Candidatus Woesearchaeota archaeon]HIH12201.1 DNA-directed RNA polymerase subunit H [Candidatus Woesearchaeota archaeon]